MNKLREEFFNLCSSAKELWENTAGTDELEPALIPILNFCKTHPKHQPLLEEYFIQLVNEPTWPHEILVFCMRELCWQKVYDAVSERIAQMREVDQMDTKLGQVLDVYEGEWKDADLYPYYSENPESS
ncbi:MAG: hypothetical protein U0401_21770 [Anaerolineae bacterium]